MRASTGRTLTTVFTLGILGAGAWWAWNNILPAIASRLQTTPTPTPTPTTPTPGAPSIDWSFLSDTAKAMADSLSLAFRNGLSGAGTQALLDQGKEGVAPASSGWHYVSPTDKNITPEALLAYWKEQLASRPADLGGYVPWTGQTTGYYDPANWVSGSVGHGQYVPHAIQPVYDQGPAGTTPYPIVVM